MHLHDGGREEGSRKMDNIIYILFVSISVPIMLMALLVEKKSRLPIIFILIGIFVSVFASEVNSLLVELLAMDVYSMTVVVTPVTEEILKMLPILYYAVVISDKKEKLFTASMAIGIGFAVLENAYYLLNYPNLSMLSAIIRAFGAGLMHGMCTLLVGVGISFVKKKSKLFYVGTFGLLSTAIVYHGIYNILIQSKLSPIGALLPIATYIPFVVWRIVSKKSSAAQG
jgi:RsiW-degrading membrane proteinase PrsW (M82 family)